jgi:hypothetical protein
MDMQSTRLYSFNTNHFRSGEIASFILTSFATKILRISGDSDALYKFVSSKLGIYMIWAVEVISRDEKKFIYAKGLIDIFFSFST